MTREMRAAVGRGEAGRSAGRIRAVAAYSMAPNKPNFPLFRPENEGRHEKQSQLGRLSHGRSRLNPTNPESETQDPRQTQEAQGSKHAKCVKQSQFSPFVGWKRGLAGKANPIWGRDRHRSRIQIRTAAFPVDPRGGMAVSNAACFWYNCRFARRPCDRSQGHLGRFEMKLAVLWHYLR
jgi:hypothetical protein